MAEGTPPDRSCPPVQPAEDHPPDEGREQLDLGLAEVREDERQQGHDQSQRPDRSEQGEHQEAADQELGRGRGRGHWSGRDRRPARRDPVVGAEFRRSSPSATMTGVMIAQPIDRQPEPPAPVPEAQAVRGQPVPEGEDDDEDRDQPEQDRVARSPGSGSPPAARPIAWTSSGIAVREKSNRTTRAMTRIAVVARSGSSRPRILTDRRSASEAEYAGPAVNAARIRGPIESGPRHAFRAPVPWR